MISQTVVVSTTCDCCGKPFELYELDDFRHSLIVSEIRVKVWYGNTEFAREICSECNQAILEFIRDRGMLKHFQRES